MIQYNARAAIDFLVLLGLLQHCCQRNVPALVLLPVFTIVGQKCCVHIHGVFPYIIMRTGVPFTPEFAAILRSKITEIVTANDRKQNFNAGFAIYKVEPFVAKYVHEYSWFLFLSKSFLLQALGAKNASVVINKY